MLNHIYLILFVLLAMSTATLANDLDDGIPIDEALSDSLKKDFNASFVVTKSVTKAKAQANKGENSKTIILKDGAGVGNIDIGAGADLKGATIINLSTNKNTTAISE